MNNSGYIFNGKKEELGRSHIIISDSEEILRTEGKKYDDNGFRVLKLDLTQKEGPQYNPFAWFRTDRDVLCFTNELVKLTGLQKTDGLLLSAMLLYLHGCDEKEAHKMQSASAFIRDANIDEYIDIDGPFECEFEAMFSDLAKDNPASLVGIQYTSWSRLNIAAKRQSVANCLYALSVFEDEKENRHDGLDLADFNPVYAKTALYIIVSPYDDFSILKAKLLLWQVRYIAAKEKAAHFENEDGRVNVLCEQMRKQKEADAASDAQTERFNTPEIFVTASLLEHFRANVYEKKLDGARWEPYFFSLEKCKLQSGREEEKKAN